MKRIITHFPVILLFILLSTTSASAQSEYGPWRTTSCFKGLDYCVKRGPYNESARKYEWWVKFRNRYSENVAFNCVLKESYVGSAKGTDRVNVRANSEGGSSWFLLGEANSVNVFIGELRFGNDDWGTKYANCDN
ncbi:MAG: hypothetical protein EOP00_10570 [Pedobacter sp.]|nr:MAG: hypothetical protein EOP00_10570 [Pedobacter sp.]